MRHVGVSLLSCRYVATGEAGIGTLHKWEISSQKRSQIFVMCMHQPPVFGLPRMSLQRCDGFLEHRELSCSGRNGTLNCGDRGFQRQHPQSLVHPPSGTIRTNDTEGHTRRVTGSKRRTLEGFMYGASESYRSGRRSDRKGTFPTWRATHKDGEIQDNRRKPTRLHMEPSR